jgi:hypothetical protein
LPRDAQLQLTVRALRAGDHRVVATVSAQGQEPDDYSATIRVRPNSQPAGKGRGADSAVARKAAPQVFRKGDN